jgi:hypothetical protein
VVVNPDWTAVIGVSVALMAVVQLAVLIGLLVAFRRTRTQLQSLQQRVEAAIDEVRPEVLAALAETREVSASMRTLASDVRGRLDAMDEATRTARERVTRVVDTVQWAASNLPVKVSGPAAMAAWAGVRVARSLIDRARRRSSIAASKPSRQLPTDYPPL